MATQGHFEDLESFRKLNAIPIRSIIETAFYGNNVVKVKDPSEAYELAKNSPGAIELTGMPVYRPTELDLPDDAKVMLLNDGAVYGRCAAARRIVGYHDVSVPEYATLLREAVYMARFRKFYSAQTVIGLEEDFMVRANLMAPHRV